TSVLSTLSLHDALPISLSGMLCMEDDIASHLLKWHKLSTERTMLYLYSGSWYIGMLRIYGKGILSMTRVQKGSARRKSRGQQNRSEEHTSELQSPYDLV